MRGSRAGPIANLLKFLVEAARQKNPGRDDRRNNSDCESRQPVVPPQQCAGNGCCSLFDG